jgi:hypothetical protein
MDYNTERNILNVELKGRIKLEEMKAYCARFIKDLSLPRSLRIFEDATNAEFDYDIEDVDQINKVIEEQIGKEHYIKHALIRNKPLETAYAMMRVVNNDNYHYSPRVFSTQQQALEWLARD